MSATQKAREAMDEYLYDAYCDAVAGGMEIEFAARCVAETKRRIDSGRSHDCDEWQAIGHARRVSKAYRERGPDAMLPDVIRCDRCHRPMAECHRPLGVGSCR
jgi:hypothetical protein